MTFHNFMIKQSPLIIHIPDFAPGWDSLLKPDLGREIQDILDRQSVCKPMVSGTSQNGSDQFFFGFPSKALCLFPQAKCSDPSNRWSSLRQELPSEPHLLQSSIRSPGEELQLHREQQPAFLLR